MTKIYIIRHAEAEGNLYRRIQGHYDSLVTGMGQKQIDALKTRFEAEHIDAVYSSDLIRTAQTATAILEPKNLPLTKMKSLREVNLGIWEDLCWGQVERDHPQQLLYFYSSPEQWAIEGAEEFHALQDRLVSSVLDIAAANDGKTVAVFTHGCAIRALLSYIKNIPPHEISTIQHCDNTAVSLLEVDGSTMTIKYMNDNSHLPDELSAFRKDTWWKQQNGNDGKNIFFEPMDLTVEGATYLECYKDAWKEAHGSHAGFTKIYLEWAKKRAASDPYSVARAYLSGQPCGIIELVNEPATPNNAGHIAFLYMSEPYRGKGLAVQLIGYAVWYFRRMGRTKLRLKVSEDNHRAHAFYKKFGFYPVGSEGGALGKIIIMEKDITRP